MKFKKITVNCTPNTADLISYVLHESGSMGEVFDDYNNVKQVLDEKRWDYADAALFTPTDGCSVSGFFTIETDENTIKEKIFALKTAEWADFSELSINTEIIDSVEWENEWKKYYVPFNIGKIAIVPQWIDYKPVYGDIPVLLDPGLAFGTGTHETTSMCIDLMQRIDLKNKRVIDFGCGSGILGICATALGASDVVFVDTDEQAIKATSSNCALNGIKDPTLMQCDVRTIDLPADVVLANITADVLIGVEQLLRSVLKSGGIAIISGIISSKKEEVEKTFKRDFKLIDSEQKNEWSAFIFKL